MEEINIIVNETVENITITVLEESGVPQEVEIVAITVTEIVENIAVAVSEEVENVTITVTEIAGEKGDPFVYEDFTADQLLALKGEDGVTPPEEFETVSKNLKSYPYAFTYGVDGLASITYDLGGGDSIVKTLNYTLGVLTSIVLSGDTPAGIDLTKTLNYTGIDLTSVTYS